MKLSVSFSEVDSLISAHFIQTKHKFNITISEIDSSILAYFIQTKCTFKTNFGEVFQIRTDNKYEGNYTVIPKTYQQVLGTKDKLMLDDVTVEIIPLSKVINLSNGYTVTIG